MNIYIFVFKNDDIHSSYAFIKPTIPYIYNIGTSFRIQFPFSSFPKLIGIMRPLIYNAIKLAYMLSAYYQVYFHFQVTEQNNMY